MNTHDTPLARSMTPKLHETIERVSTLDDLREKLADVPAGRRWVERRRSTAYFRFLCAFADQKLANTHPVVLEDGRWRLPAVDCQEADALLADYRRGWKR